MNFTPAELGNQSISGDNADPDGDGLSNLLERALGHDPHHSDFNAFVDLQSDPAAAGRRWTLYYNKSANDLRFEVQQSSSLNSGTWSHQGVSPELYDGARGLFYQYLVTPQDEPEHFLRLQVLPP